MSLGNVLRTFDWNAFGSLEREFDRLFHGLTQGSAAADFAINVWSDPSAFYVEAEVPGARPEDLDIGLEGDLLTIRALIHAEDLDEKHTSLRAERRTGELGRTIKLSAPVDADAIVAKYHDGVLRITLPIAREAQARKIAVNSGKDA